MIKVAKFGGSSVADANQFRKVKEIILKDSSRKFVISSACGKCNGDDHKVTDLLYLCAAHVKYGVDCSGVLTMIENKYAQINDELDLKFDIKNEFNQIKEMISKSLNTDYLVSRGEYLTTKMLCSYVGGLFVDAKDVIKFNYDGSVDLEASKEALSNIDSDGKVVFIPGFYGSLPNGVIKVMERGGSDITGAIISNLVDADVYENWTDVSGFMIADPRIVENPLSIRYITYNELREMSYMGANVLHDDAIFPVKIKNIPINIRNTNEMENPGTLIMNDCSKVDKVKKPYIITGITGKKDFVSITIVKSHSSTEVGFLRKVLSVFDEYNVSIEAVPITVDTFSIIVHKDKVENCLYELVARLKELIKPDDIFVDDKLSLVAVVGRGMKSVPGMSGRLLSEFGNHQINIKVINQSADELSIVVGVDNDDFNRSIQAIYDKFIKEEEL